MTIFLFQFPFTHPTMHTKQSAFLCDMTPIIQITSKLEPKASREAAWQFFHATSARSKHSLSKQIMAAAGSNSQLTFGVETKIKTSQNYCSQCCVDYQIGFHWRNLHSKKMPPPGDLNHYKSHQWGHMTQYCQSCRAALSMCVKDGEKWDWFTILSIIWSGWITPP